MGFSIPHLVLMLAVVLLLFGRGKISELMGDFAKGIRSFKGNLADDRIAEAPGSARRIDEVSAGGPL